MTTYDTTSWTNDSWNSGNPLIYGSRYCSGMQIVSGGILDGKNPTQVDMIFKKNGTPSNAMTARIYTPPASGTELGTLRSLSNTLSSGSYVTDDILTFTFSGDITLSAGDIICIFSDNSGSSSESEAYNWAVKTASTGVDNDVFISVEYNTSNGWEQTLSYNKAAQVTYVGSSGSAVTFIPPPIAHVRI